MKVVVSIGGSVLVPSVGADRIQAFGEELRALHETEHDIAVVVGGGSVAREYIETARKLEADEVALDQLGIDVTRLNARLLIEALGSASVSSPLQAFDPARDALRQGDIPVMGGTVPGHTTDAVATALAERVNADLLVYATSVAGVFDADPGSDSSARKFDHLTPAALVEVIAEIEMEAGSNAPVDLLAAKFLQRSGLSAVVLDGSEPGRISDAVEGIHDGTEISPEQ